MAIGIVLLLSLVSALCMSWGAGAFESAAWLWVIPCGFLGSFLAIAALVFLVVWIMSEMVDMEKPEEKDSAVYRWVAHVLIELLVPFLQVRIHTKGLEMTPKSGRVLLVCNHLNDIDPAVLLRYFPKLQLAFISKRENEKKPIIGPFQKKIMCQSVNRENDREALRTILNCIRLLKEDQVSIAVFPEGYVSLDKKLHRFRSGVFKIALKTKVPIVVCTLTNTHHAFANAKKLKPTDIDMHLVGVIYPQEYEGMTAVDVSNKVYDMMAEDLGPDLVLQEA